MRRVLLAILVAVAAIAAVGQTTPSTPGVTVTATLVDGSGNIEKTGFLHFELFNCGTYVPQVLNNPTAIVEKQFDLHPDPTTGLVSGSIYGNNQIYCGNVLSTQWIVTLYKATAQVGIPATNYCLTAPGTFDPSVNTPCTTPPPLPGFQYVLSNPVLNQTVVQPTGTTGYFIGNYDFSGANITGLNAGAQPAGGDYYIQFALGGALDANQFFTFNPLNTTLTVGAPSPTLPGVTLAADSMSYLTTSLVPPAGDNSNRLATTSFVQTNQSNWNSILNKPTTFPPPVPTTSAIGGVFMPADCPTGNHVYGINLLTGQLKCAPDTNSQITLQANGVTVGTGLTTFNFVASAGLNIAAAVNSGTGVVTFTITGSTATQAQIPSFSPLPGAYSSGQSVTMTCASPSPTIYYTTDGSTPTHGSTVYSTPVAVTNTTVKAICASSGLTDSNVQTGVYSLTAPAVTLSTTTLAFGNQIVGTPSAYQSFTITNTGTASLTISSIVTSGDYSLTTDCGGTLAAGALCTVNVRINASTLGADNGGVTITDSAAGSPHSVTTTATGVQPSSVPSPATLTFASQGVNTSSAAQNVTVTNSSAFPLTVSSVTITGTNANQFSQTNNCTTVAGSGGTCTIAVVFTPTASGSMSATLNVNDNAAGSPQTVALSGTGAAPPAPVDSIAPSSLSFSAQTVGTTSNAQTVTLTNTGTAALLISSISISGTQGTDFGQTNNCTTIAMGNSCTVSVTFSPGGSGTRTGTMSIVDNTTGSPYTVSLTGIGGYPNVSITPGTLTYGNQTVGTTSAAQTSTITNISIVPLVISSIVSSGPFAQTNNCPNSLPVGNSCTVQVTFSPTAAGAVTGAITYTVNLPAGGTLSTALKGTGISPVFSGVPPSASFVCQETVNCPTSRNYTITNTGNATLSVTSVIGTPSFTGTLTGCGTVAPNGTCTLTISFLGGQIGQTTGTMTINHNAPGSPFQINLSGITTQPPPPH